jgi:hypothetical protein
MQQLIAFTQLNAAANHGYLPRNGIASIEQTVSGLGKLYNLGPRISAVLAAPKDELTAPLLGTGQG